MFSSIVETVLKELQQYTLQPLLLVGSIIAVYFIDFIIPIDFNHYGIHPRSLDGLLGIPLSPFLHGNVTHLFSNIVPLFVLGLLLRHSGSWVFIRASALLILCSGLFTWLLSSAPVIGASALVFAYWTYLITSAIHRRTLRTLIIAGITLLLYGGLILSLTHIQEGVSWAGHFSGALAGVLLGIFQPLKAEEDTE